jgi:hypothetical protein
MADYFKTLAEPIGGGKDAVWKEKSVQKEYKDGWKCSIHQKSQKG